LYTTAEGVYENNDYPIMVYRNVKKVSAK